MKAKNPSVKLLTVSAMFAAIIYIFTAFFHIPSHTGYTHVGDAFVYLALDADPAVTMPLAELAQAKVIEIIWVGKMHDLGRACDIDVGAAAAATLPEC